MAMSFYQLGAATNFGDLVKFGDCRQIRRSQMFIKLVFEFRCDVIFYVSPNHAVARQQTAVNIDFRPEVFISQIKQV